MDRVGPFNRKSIAKTIIDEEVTYHVKCPSCDAFKRVDMDQLEGKVDLYCFCGFHGRWNLKGLL